jgi:hypothetical protein
MLLKEKFGMHTGFLKAEASKHQIISISLVILENLKKIK